ncbi:uncharacterized protein LOC120104612 [Phoenix dactylifera]|uniref:Uncharacterized protein LOC120104612 n=1 Tax=Phoenix dactylifera TaxID=42345 RepID=A0A8B8ZCZ8_PHODC|nr:uncharacterized protein LOC120104612 [Phoenix dactylifera]
MDHSTAAQRVRAVVMGFVTAPGGGVEERGHLGSEPEDVPATLGEDGSEADYIHCPEICLLYETRLSGEGLSRLRRRMERDWETYAVDSQGLSGGILVLWRRGVATIDVFHNCSQQVIMVISTPDAAPWVLCGVYASTDHRVRRILWQEITDLTAQGIPAVVIGDFNCILSQDEKRGALPSRIEWTGGSSSWDIVRDAWRIPVHGDPMQQVSRKLELTKRRLRRWNRVVVGDIFRRLEGVESSIAELQRKEDLGGTLPEVDMADLRGLLATHHSLLRQHEIFWRQKSRVQWVSEGDRNTRFFHRSTIIRRRRSMIHSLRDGSGHRVESEPAIRQSLLDFFRTRWTVDEEASDGDRPLRVDVGIRDVESVALAGVDVGGTGGSLGQGPGT